MDIVDFFMQKAFSRVYIFAIYGVIIFMEVYTVLFIFGFQSFAFFSVQIWVEGTIPLSQKYSCVL